MLSKIVLVFAVLAVALQLAAATPPACLLTALTQQKNAGDMKTLCSSGYDDVQAAIKSACKDDAKAASDAFSSTCGQKSDMNSNTTASVTQTGGAGATGYPGPSSFISSALNGTAVAPTYKATGVPSATAMPNAAVHAGLNAGPVAALGAAIGMIAML